jgi:dephospho-CoA kinase
MTIKIAVSGKLGSGKDLFLYLANLHFPDLKFENAKFATPLYHIAYDMQRYLGLPDSKDGELLQFIGNHYRKNDPSFWVKRFPFESPLVKEHNVIVTDIRYPEELDACRQNGFVTVRIHRQDEYRLNNLGNRDLKHASETALDSTPNYAYDYVVNNNGTLDLYEGAVIRIIDEVLRRN